MHKIHWKSTFECAREMRKLICAWHSVLASDEHCGVQVLPHQNEKSLGDLMFLVFLRGECLVFWFVVWTIDRSLGWRGNLGPQKRTIPSARQRLTTLDHEGGTNGVQRCSAIFVQRASA